MKGIKLVPAVVVAILSLLATSCVSTNKPLTVKNSQLTTGNIQMNLKVGQTTKNDVLEAFGSPNITTRDGSGQEVWSYQRAAQVAQASSQSGGFTIILAGASSSNSSLETSSSMVTLIIKFDEKDIVSDFKSRTSNF